VNPPTRRPRSTTCPQCGQPVSLSRCGVDEHMRTRTRREIMDGRCTGRVYIHDVTGGIECEDVRA
jgi:hypothetical protein